MRVRKRDGGVKRWEETDLLVGEREKENVMKGRGRKTGLSFVLFSFRRGRCDRKEQEGQRDREKMREQRRSCRNVVHHIWWSCILGCWALSHLLLGLSLYFTIMRCLCCTAQPACAIPSHWGLLGVWTQCITTYSFPSKWSFIECVSATSHQSTVEYSKVQVNYNQILI